MSRRRPGIRPSQTLDVAVDADRLARQIASRLGREEQNRRCDVLSADHAPQRNAIEIGLLHRLIGHANLFRPGVTPVIRGPSTIPGRMALTRILAGPNSLAKLWVKPMTPHLAAE
jgi:hypothetical protein